MTDSTRIIDCKVSFSLTQREVLSVPGSFHTTMSFRGRCYQAIKMKVRSPATLPKKIGMSTSTGVSLNSTLEDAGLV